MIFVKSWIWGTRLLIHIKLETELSKKKNTHIYLSPWEQGIEKLIHTGKETQPKPLAKGS